MQRDKYRRGRHEYLLGVGSGGGPWNWGGGV